MGQRVSDLVAINVGAARFVVGAPVAPEAIADFDALTISLSRDGETLHDARGSDAAGGQAASLMPLINQIVERGHVIRAGEVILAGVVGPPRPARPRRAGSHRPHPPVAACRFRSTGLRVDPETRKD